MSLVKILPIIEWLPKINRYSVFSDLIAGITVATLSIPQCLSYAEIAGLPYQYGIYTGFIPGIVYVFFGTSNILSLGPVSLISLLVASSLEDIELPGCSLPLNDSCPTQYVEKTIVLSFIVGIIQLLCALLGIYKLAIFLGEPIISGFISSASIIIILGQLKNVLGYDIDNSHYFIIRLKNIFENIDKFNLLNFSLSFVSIFILIVIDYYSKKSNKIKKLKSISFFLLCVSSILLVWGCNLHSKLKIVGDIPGNLPQPILPKLSVKNINLIVPSIFISLIGFIESISISGKFKLNKIDERQEMLALGVSNLVSSFFQCYPSTGSFSRSSINNEAGAKTNLSNIFSSIFIIVSLYLFTGFIKYLPKFCLAAIIISCVVRLFDYKKAIEYYKKDKINYLLWITTFSFSILFGIIWGIVSGIIMSFFVLIYKHAYPEIKTSKPEKYLDILNNYKISIIQVESIDITYININYILNYLETLLDSCVIFDMRFISRIDSCSKRLLMNFIKENDIIIINQNENVKLIESKQINLKSAIQYITNKNKFGNKLNL